PVGTFRSVSELFPPITSPVRFVRPPGRETLVAPLRLRSKKTRLVRFDGRLKLASRFWDKLRLVNLIGPPGKAQFVRELPLRSRTKRLVSVFGSAKLLR